MVTPRPQIRASLALRRVAAQAMMAPSVIFPHPPQMQALARMAPPALLPSQRLTLPTHTSHTQLMARTLSQRQNLSAQVELLAQVSLKVLPADTTSPHRLLPIPLMAPQATPVADRILSQLLPQTHEFSLSVQVSLLLEVYRVVHQCQPMQLHSPTHTILPQHHQSHIPL